MILAIVLALLVGGGVVLFFVGLNQTFATETEVEARLGAVMGKSSGAAPAQVKGPQEESALAQSIQKAVVKTTYGQKIARDLAQADLKLTVGEFVTLRFILAGLGAAIGYLAGLFNTLIAGFPLGFAIAGAFIGYKFPGFYVGRRKGGRLNAFNAQLPDTITLLANSLRAGSSLAQGMDLISREARPPTNQEFGRVVAEMSLGLSPDEALSNLVRRVPSPDLDLMVTSMNVQREVGGNLAQVLESIGNTIRERVRIKGDIETLTAQQQGAGYIVSILPLLIGGVLFLLNGKYMKPMFSGIFLCMPIGAGVMIFIGFMVMKGITSIEV